MRNMMQSSNKGRMLFHAEQYRQLSGHQWWIQQFWRKGVEDNVSAPSSFVTNAHNELYAFHTGKDHKGWHVIRFID